MASFTITVHARDEASGAFGHIKTLMDSMRQQSQQMGGQAAQAAKSAGKKMNEEFKNAAVEMRNTIRDAFSGATTFGTMQNQLQRFRDEIRRIKDELRVSGSTKPTEESIDQLRGKLSELVVGVREYSSELRRMRTQNRQFTAEQGKAAEASDKLAIKSAAAARAALASMMSMRGVVPDAAAKALPQTMAQSWDKLIAGAKVAGAQWSAELKAIEVATKASAVATSAALRSMMSMRGVVPDAAAKALPQTMAQSWDKLIARTTAEDIQRKAAYARVQSAFAASGHLLPILSQKDIKVDRAAIQKQAEEAARLRSQAIGRFVNSTIAVGSRAMQAIEGAFLSRGFFGAITRSLFAPLAGVKRGFDEFGRAATTAFNILSRPSFRAATDSFRVLGHVIRGVTEITGGLVAQMGRLAGLPFNLVGSLVKAFSGGFGKLFGAGLGGVGKLFGVAGDIFGEVIAIAGKAMGGLADIVAAGLKPIAAAFDFLISPITTAFSIIKMAWSFSLLAMTGAAVVFVKSSISTFMQFEKQVTRVLSQLPIAAADAFDKFGAEAMKLSRELGKSPIEIADAMQLAVSVGFSNIAEASELARNATRLSIASFSDLKTTMEAMTNVMNSYGLAAKDSAGVADLLKRGHELAGGEMNDFAHGLGMVASSVHAVGGSMEDLVGITALLSRAASGNTRIFPQIQQLFEELVVPSSKSAAAMGMLNVQMQKGAHGGVDLFKTLFKIDEALDNMVGQDVTRRAEVLKKLFPETREFRGASAAFAASLKSLTEIQQGVGNVAGAVDVGFKAQADKLFRMGDILGATWLRIKIAVGTGLKPIWMSAVQGVEQFLAKIEEAGNSGRFAGLRNSLADMFGVFTSPGGFTEAVIGFFEATLPNAINEHVIPALNTLKEWTHGFDIKATLADVLQSVADSLERFADSDFVHSLDKAADKLMKGAQFALDYVKSWQEISANKPKQLEQLKGGSGGQGLGDLFESFTRPSRTYGPRISGGAAGGIVPGAPSRTDNRIIRVRSGEEIVTPEDPRHVRNIRGYAGGGEVGGGVGFGAWLKKLLWSDPEGTERYRQKQYKPPSRPQANDEDARNIRKTKEASEETNRLLKDLISKAVRGAQFAGGLFRGRGLGGPAAGAAAGAAGGALPVGAAAGAMGGGMAGGGVGPPPVIPVPPGVAPPDWSFPPRRMPRRPFPPRDWTFPTTPWRGWGSGVGPRRGRDDVSPRQKALDEVRVAHEQEMQDRRAGRNAANTLPMGPHGGAGVVMDPTERLAGLAERRRASGAIDFGVRKGATTPQAVRDAIDRQKQKDAVARERRFGGTGLGIFPAGMDPMAASDKMLDRRRSRESAVGSALAEQRSGLARQRLRDAMQSKGFSGGMSPSATQLDVAGAVGRESTSKNLPIEVALNLGKEANLKDQETMAKLVELLQQFIRDKDAIARVVDSLKASSDASKHEPL